MQNNEIIKLTVQEFIDGFPEAIYLKDEERRLVQINKAHAQGQPKGETLIGRKDEDFLTQTNLKEIIEKEKELLKYGKILYDTLEKITFPDGTEHSISTTKVPWKNEQGNIIGLMGISRDVTGRVAMLDMLISNHPSCCFVTSVTGKWELINKAGIALFGCKDEKEMKTMKAQDFYCDLDARKPFIKEIEIRGFVKNYRINFYKKDKKTIIHTSVTATARKDAKGKTTGFHGIIEDITSVVDEEERLKKVELKIKKAKQILSKSASDCLKLLSEDNPKISTPLSCLTSALREVFDLIAIGKTNTEIRQILKISKTAVEQREKRIRKILNKKTKQNIRDRAGLIRYAEETGHLIRIYLP